MFGSAASRTAREAHLHSTAIAYAAQAPQRASVRCGLRAGSALPLHTPGAAASEGARWLGGRLYCRQRPAQCVHGGGQGVGRLPPCCAALLLPSAGAALQQRRQQQLGFAVPRLGGGASAPPPPTPAPPPAPPPPAHRPLPGDWRGPNSPGRRSSSGSFPGGGSSA